MTSYDVTKVREKIERDITERVITQLSRIRLVFIS